MKNQLVITATVTLLGICTLAGQSIAGTDMNGTDMNGTDMNGVALHMSGESFVGVRFDVERHGASLVAVLAFRGARLQAQVWDTQAGWRASELHPRELIGLQWVESRCRGDGCARRTYRVTGAAQDHSQNTMPAFGSNADIWLHDVEYSSGRIAPASRWRPACRADARGLARGLFLTGAWYPDGSRSERGYTFSCTTGAIAKCVRNWGYKPWKTLSATSGARVPLGSLHHACTRAVRADYCGTGHSFTRDGTYVDIADRYGFNIRDPTTRFQPEAGFSTDGAVWVARPRWPMDSYQQRTAAALSGCLGAREILPGSARTALIEVWSALAPGRSKTSEPLG